MVKRIFYLFFGFLTLAALVIEFINTENIINFFSYFTILSNIFATILFLFIGVIHKKNYSTKLDFLFGATIVYIFVAAVGYWVFLRDLPVERPWANNILHILTPIACFIGLFLRPNFFPNKYQNAVLWMTFPVFYTIYTFIRGQFAMWYPYDFLDPRDKGYYGVFLYILLFSLLTYVSGLGVIFLSRIMYGRVKINSKV